MRHLLLRFLLDLVGCGCCLWVCLPTCGLLVVLCLRCLRAFGLSWLWFSVGFGFVLRLFVSHIDSCFRFGLLLC